MIDMEIGKYTAPKTLDEALMILQSEADSKIMAGGAWIKLSLKKVGNLIALDNLNLAYIKEEKSYVEIGSMTSLRALETNSALKEIASGILPNAIGKIMGINVRNLATIGGSVMGRFSFSDLMAVLLVLDSRLIFHEFGEMKISDFLELKKVPNDILVSIKIPKNEGKGYFKKVSKTPLDFAIVNMAIIKDKNFKIAVGSRPAMAKLAEKAGQYLDNCQVIDDDAVNNAVDTAIEELTISSNLRAQKDYRELLVKTYLKRGIKQVINDEA
jgi:CO/xanthine dehydrogenase FAD-binding subunit